MWIDKELYIARKILPSEIDDYGNEISHYDKPIKYQMAYMPLTSQVDYQIYGALVNNMLVAYVDKRYYLGKIKGGDIAYLIDTDIQDIESLVINDENNNTCPSANYRVKYAQLQNFKIKIVFEKI